MAVHGQPEPPRTLETFRQWAAEAPWYHRPARTEALQFPDGQAWLIAPGADHPFAGHSFCWRCVAEAFSVPASGSHKSTHHTICWRPAERDTSTEDSQQNPRPPGDESTSDWTEAGRQYVAEAVGGNHITTEGVDTGTFFYSAPPKSPPAARRPVIRAEGTVRVTKLDTEGNPVGEPQDLSATNVSFESSGSWDGWPSWTDDQPVPDKPVWEASTIEIPLPPDVVNAALEAIEQAGDES